MSARSRETVALSDGLQDLTAEEYELFRRLVYEQSGINLGPQKQQLLRARLGKLLRGRGFRSYRAYYEYVRGDASGNELCALIDAISTNTTHLFRERQHFDFLAEVLRARWVDAAASARPRNLRIWSAGCSSGEEPYSIAMTVDDTLAPLGRYDWKLLATDVSTRMLAKAREGVFEAHRLGTVPDTFRRRYFVPAAGAAGCVQIRPELRQRICFSRLNLMDEQFPFRHGFDFIFCRNVMIYFDRATQTRLVAKFARHLRPGGHLLIGHSESLNNIEHPLTYVRPTIYRRGAP